MRSQVRIGQPCWPEVGLTSEMITLSVHWREQLARRWVPVRVWAIVGPTVGSAMAMEFS